MKSNLTDYMEKLHPGLGDYAGRAMNVGESYLFSLTSGVGFRLLMNEFFGVNSQMTHGFMPFDELLGPLAYYGVVFGIDKLGRYMNWVDDSSAIKKYAPHAVTALLTCGVWESAQYIGLLDDVKMFQQTFTGTVKDVIMRLVSIGSYKSEDCDKSIVEKMIEKFSHLLTETRK